MAVSIVGKSQPQMGFGLVAKIELVAKSHPRAGANRFRKPEDAHRFLRNATLDPEQLAHFREIWRTSKKKSSGPLPPDRKLLADLAELMAAGQLRTVLVAQLGGSSGQDDWTPTQPAPRPRQEQRAAPSGEAPLKIRPPAGPGLAAAPEPALEVALQVQALIRAAQIGAPFCEVCEASK